LWQGIFVGHTVPFATAEAARVRRRGRVNFIVGVGMLLGSWKGAVGESEVILVGDKILRLAVRMVFIGLLNILMP
jgi:hypothetical protein